MKTTVVVLLAVIAMSAAAIMVEAKYTATGACVAHKFSCCPMVTYKVDVDHIEENEEKTCKEIARFAASKENTSPECLKAHIKYKCLDIIPSCESDSNRVSGVVACFLVVQVYLCEETIHMSCSCIKESIVL